MRPIFAWLGLMAFVAVGQPTYAHQGADPSAIEHDLEIHQPGATAARRLDLASALKALNVPSVSIALIDHGGLAWARAYGNDTSTRTLYQAASLSKLVTAVAALRLVQQGKLDLDRSVDTELTSWHIPASDLTRDHPVTLRGLLSMTGGIGVPGYIGYAPGRPLPSLKQILVGGPPANSSSVRVDYVPGSRYAYSGGGYEIVQAILEDTTHQSFAQALQDLVLQPAGMMDSLFEQPLPKKLAVRAAAGHYADGTELPGRWRVVPELAAGGLWSTPTDLAKLLVAISRAYRGDDTSLLTQRSAQIMLTRQNHSPYGLGGAVTGSGPSLALMKRGQNIGYQCYMLIFPETGQGMVVMTNSDNGTVLVNALIHRAAEAYGWPPIDDLPD